MNTYRVRLVADHISTQLSAHRHTWAARAKGGNETQTGTRTPPPLFVGLQGPQGSGE